MASGSDALDDPTIQVIIDGGDSLWFQDIVGALGKDDLEDNYDMGVCIFEVPDAVLNVKPEAYRPQLIALGLYHHFQPELYQMEHYKLAMVKKAIKPKFDLLKFANLVQGIVGEAHAILKCYSAQGILKSHSGLTSSTALSDNKIGWIMAIDALFLLDLLNTPISQQPHYAIYRDVLKLENQIPLLVLKVIHEKLQNRPRSYYPPLYDMLVKFCHEISPIQLDPNATSTTPPTNSDEVLEYRHLLGFLYHSVTYKKDDRQTYGLAVLIEDHCRPPSKDSNLEGQPQPNKSAATFSDIFNRLSSLRFIGKSVKKVLTALAKMLPLVPIPSMAFFKEKKVLIPSVSELCGAGVRFWGAIGGTKNVEFDEKTKTLKLPVITLNRTTDVVMRNLVAYETMAKSKTRSSNFKRFTELMSAIVDTIEDVQLLKEAKVLIVQKKDAQVPDNDQKEDILSDAEIVEIFNGMTKTMESKDRVIDEAIRKVNKCYSNTKKVKAYRLMKKHIYSSWKLLTLLAALLLLLLTALQTFCGVYSCPNLFHTNPIKQT